MNDIVTQQGTEYNQSSFSGGMNLLGDDSRLQPNQYRVGFDLTNRYDTLDPVLASVQDTAIPKGIIQEITTFGNFVIAFVSGYAYYRYYSQTQWTKIVRFSMDALAPRYWTKAIPVATTNYIRIAASATLSSNTYSNPAGSIITNQVAGASAGNLPGLLVQDNINQPQFIFLDSNGNPTCRTTQNYEQWMISYTDATNTVVATDPNLKIPMDYREYVPIGNTMDWDNDILYVASQDGNSIYRSVSGRPLDFVVNVVNTLAANAAPTQITNSNGINITVPAFTQIPGGDATTTAYSVGVGGITCLRALSSGGVFVAAGDANFNVTLNQTPNAPTLFGEYRFNRKYLFEATCLSDRAIFDSIGDTRFIDLTGVRSFNAIQQQLNEGRNLPFTANVQAAFGNDTNPIIQSPAASAAILYNDYEYYAVDTIFGPAILKYDTINSCWVSFDLQQTNGVAIKQFAKIELAVRQLFAVTIDNKLWVLYSSNTTTSPSFRGIGVSGNILYANSNIKMNNPKREGRLNKCRVIVNRVTQSGEFSFTPYVNNRLTQQKTQTKTINYTAPTIPNTQSDPLPDVDTGLYNILFSTTDCGTGWKTYGVFSWTVGSVTQFSFEIEEMTPINPIQSQESVQ